MCDGTKVTVNENFQVMGSTDWFNGCTSDRDVAARKLSMVDAHHGVDNDETKKVEKMRQVWSQCRHI